MVSLHRCKRGEGGEAGIKGKRLNRNVCKWGSGREGKRGERRREWGEE